MRIQQDGIRLSASDVSNHLGCRHLTELDLAAAVGKLKPPVWRNAALEALQQRGFEHEQAYLDHLRGLGLLVVDVDRPDTGTAIEATTAAMRAGVDVIVQATLADGRWFGRADVLQRVAAKSDLGDWSYEVVDTKLARETRAGTILQLCLYSEIVGGLQGRLPDAMHVVSPGSDFTPETFRINDYLAYYRFVKNRLAEVTRAETADGFSTYPEPVAQCDICRWWKTCDSRRRKDDHLSLVAGVSKLQRRELESWGVCTLAELAKLPLPLEQRPKHGNAESIVRVREQARVQLEGREQQAPVFELLDREPERGLNRLPEPSPGDIFFDIEGARFVGEGGREYLFGWVELDDSGDPMYRELWAYTEGEEHQKFETFMDYVVDRWAQYPDLHIYHYAPYEPGAVKRLMGRYATREDEADRMLRAELFVDLYTTSRQAIRASVERYSIKDLEQFYGYVRDVELREASLSLRAIEHALESGQVDGLSDETRAVVRGYNRDDCVSTLRLRDWLEELRAELVESGEQLSRPEPGDGGPSEEVDDRRRRVLELREKLVGDVPIDRAERSEHDQARWLLAYLLDWHRREEKAPWWEYFRLRDMDVEELLDATAGLAGLEYQDNVEGTRGLPTHRYQFPSQEADVRVGDPLHQPGGAAFGTVAAIDVRSRTVDVKKRRDTEDLHCHAVFAHKVIGGKTQAEALFRLGDWVAQHGIDAAGSYRAGRDLLLGIPPRLVEALPPGTALQPEGEASLDAAKRLCLGLDGSVLAIQGPPGTGKTYTGARMICALVSAGKKVGITANSHVVIRNILDEVVEAAKDEGISVQCIQKPGGKAAKDEGQPIWETTDNGAMLAALQDGSAQVAGGTTFLWAREEMHEAVDVLFVDEAGQMALANAVAASQAAKNLVLLGDPQQLDQPLQGSHPDGTDASALEHVLGGKQTMPPEQGLFLAETWRLHPSIAGFTSELFYEGRLRLRPDLAAQDIVGDTAFAGSGLRFVPVDHDGNRNRSVEEVDRVAEIYQTLLAGDHAWVDRHGETRPITEKDVMIVAPYNAHVGALAERLPSAWIGTVDKFQGQEAPVVIYSMATSSAEDAPRGMEFLFSLNRLNVATSRARCVCILVANPRLFEADCRTPRQIRLANAFCRYHEMAATV